MRDDVGPVGRDGTDDRDHLADAIDEVIRSRRTSLLVDPDLPVADETIDELIELATWAPNHKRTWPWSFTVISGDARRRFGEQLAIAGRDAGLPEPKVAKLGTKYARAATVLLVWTRVAEDPIRRREDRDAVAAAVQNLLLAATARGLGNYWASIPEPLLTATRAFAGVEDTDDLVALIYLGWPTACAIAPARPEPPVTRHR